jgi:peptide-methionine (R)-S-oxide reductase
LARTARNDSSYLPRRIAQSASVDAVERRAQRRLHAAEEARMTAQIDLEALRRRLTPLQYAVTQEAATEPPFSGIYADHHEPGTYRCVVCGVALFDSNEKYDSRCGWPSFYDMPDKGRVVASEDRSFGMVRTEIRCAACGAHLGHLFDDGPKPTGRRYCINSASLDFEKR